MTHYLKVNKCGVKCKPKQNDFPNSIRTFLASMSLIIALTVGITLLVSSNPAKASNVCFTECTNIGNGQQQCFTYCN